MSLRKALIAAALLAAVLYGKNLLPELSDVVLPALREAISVQATLYVPPSVEPWLLWS